MSLLFGILGGILVSVITGIVALNKTKDGRQGGRGMAIAGLALSGAWVLILGAVALLPYGSDNGAPETDARPTPPTVGDYLLEIPEDGLVTRIATVACDQPHLGEVFATIAVPDGDSIGLYTFFPNIDTWASGHLTVTCIATSDTPRTGSLRG